MKQVIHKLFFVWQFEQEEAWLNEMAARGQVLTDVGFCRYTFEDCRPGEYNVRLELLEEPVSKQKSIEYLAFVEDTGAEFVGNFTRWVYFRKKTTDGPFDLYSDASSRLKHMNRVIGLLHFVILMNLIVGINNLILLGLNYEHTAINVVGLLNILIVYFGWKGSIALRRKRDRIQQEGSVFE